MMLLNLCLLWIAFWLSSCSLAVNGLEIGDRQNLTAIRCHADDIMTEYYNSNRKALAEMQQFEIQSRRFINNRRVPTSYVIPVVFHVYGTDFAGQTVNDNTIILALEKLNDDFHGLNRDFNTVDPEFQQHRSTFDVTFKLARKDPNGQSTTGIIYYPAKNGYASEAFNEHIQKDAWDNYKYCNVYIQLDLYNNGALTNSGVANYPDTGLSDANLARIVYNGRSLYGNTDEEFASVLTHEFGHWLNLIHTFLDGCQHSSEHQCDYTGDRVCDTPQTSGNQGCKPIKNCAGKSVNSENYMDYSGAYGCYKMFTAGQVARMEAAMQHPARITLWQVENLIATGVENSSIVDPCSSSPCLNEGSCLELNDTFVCVCKPLYTGSTCSQQVATTSTTSMASSTTSSSSCSPNPCMNGGKCYKMRDSFVCVCPSPYTGLQCEGMQTATQSTSTPSSGSVTCAQNPCKNGGICYNAVAGYYCFCGSNTKVTGKNCESMVN